MRLTADFDLRAVARFAADARAQGIAARDTLIAVSGGPDSLALLLLARAALGADISVATVDHGLRPEAGADAAHVAAVADMLGVGRAVLTVSVAPDGRGLQAAARDARYAALADHARGIARGTVLTAHHADDQAETLLMRLGRGSGLGGLAGIRAEKRWGTVRIVRPLLHWTRAELAGIVAGAGLTAVDDPSNRDPRHDRTHVRALLKVADPRGIARAAANLADAEAALVWATLRAAESTVTADGDGRLLDPRGLPDEIVRRLVVAMLIDAGADPSGPAVARLIARLRRGATATLGGTKISPGPVWRFTAAPPRRRVATGAGPRSTDAIVH